MIVWHFELQRNSESFTYLDVLIRRFSGLGLTLICCRFRCGDIRQLLSFWKHTSLVCVLSILHQVK